MTTANYGQSEISIVLSQARVYNQEIGSYVGSADKLVYN